MHIAMQMHITYYLKLENCMLLAAPGPLLSAVFGRQYQGVISSVTNLSEILSTCTYKL